MSQSTKGNRYQISFKETLEELELMNYMLDQSKIIGISAYLKTLIMKDKNEKKKE